MSTMQALIFHEPGKISVEERPIPRISQGEVLIQVGATSVCASDIRVYKGEKKARAGVIPGHEIAGQVAALGDGVDEVALGDRVVVCPIIACGECYFCLVGKRNRCLRRLTLGYDEDGGFAHYLRVPQGIVKLGHIIKIPQNMDYEIACMTEPFACVLNSLESCRVQPGNSLLIIGAGPMGLIHLVLARAMGAAKVIISDPVEERRRTAEELGAAVCVNPQKQSLLKEVLSATGGMGADAGILSVGAVAPVEEGLSAVRKQGYFNLFAGFPPGSQLTMDANRIHYDELFLTGTQNATTDQYARVSQMLSVLPVARKLITHRLGPAEANKAYEARLGLEGLKSVVLYQ
ncbi:MAG: alcohol dehydrogenase catalytic domain-containing protein [Chloroflexi bacterium]|nr:alcohol dehydrogenase catalytic domain-containing protein [Chloroflexota bacterium]